MDLVKTMDRLYYDMVLAELQMMHDDELAEKITYNSLLYLDLIVYKKNCTVTYLANALHISKSAVTIKVNELVKQGIVEKIQDEDDKRIHYIQAVPHIAEKFRKFDRKANVAAQRMEQEFSQKELEQFCKMLEAYTRYYRGGEEK